jgi:hypothetical protein
LRPGTVRGEFRNWQIRFATDSVNRDARGIVIRVPPFIRVRPNNFRLILGNDSRDSFPDSWKFECGTLIHDVEAS